MSSHTSINNHPRSTNYISSFTDLSGCTVYSESKSISAKVCEIIHLIIKMKYLRGYQFLKCAHLDDPGAQMVDSGSECAAWKHMSISRAVDLWSPV